MVVVSIAEHLALPLPQLVQRPRDTDHQALHAATQRVAPAGLDDQVQVVVEDRVVRQAEAEAVAAGEECRAQRRVFGLPPQPRQSLPQLARHMYRKARRQRCALTMAHARALALRFAARTLAGTTVVPERQLALLGR
jgi:hypothetical protein